MTLELFEQGPGVYVPILLVSILITAVSYAAYPLLLARFRRKPISARKYRVFCYLFNFLVMVLFIALNGSSSGAPYVLWTSVFCHCGKNTLEHRNLLAQPNVSASIPSSEPSSGTVTEYTGKFQQSVISVPVCGKPKRPKSRFCKLCGSPIDPSTRKCTGCGKQYFRLPARKKSGLVPKVLVILSLLIAGLCIYRNIQYQNQIAGLNARIIELESAVETMEAQHTSDEALISDLRKKNAGNNSKVYTLSQQIEKMQRVYDFCNDHVVVVSDDGTRTYHKIQCFYFDDSYFWAYNTEKAQQLGYSPCSFCFSRYFDSLTN